MNIRDLFQFKSEEERISRYRTNLRRYDELTKSIDELANEFICKKEMFKSGNFNQEEYNDFLDNHFKNLSDLKNDLDKVQKSLSKEEKKYDFIKDIKAFYELKKCYQNNQISLEKYNEILKAKSGSEVVSYADVLVIKNNKLLILQRTEEDGISRSDKWCIPGGHVEIGETFRQAAKRELYEETGLEVIEGDLREVAIAKGKDFEIHYFMYWIGQREETEHPDNVNVVLDATEEIGSEWIDCKDIDEKEFLFEDMKNNIKRILGIEFPEMPLIKLTKSFIEGRISKSVLQKYIEEHPDEIEKAKNKTYFSHTERKDLADKGEAMPNGKYPIRNKQDLKDAIRLSGSSDMPKEKVKAWIKKRAKELNLENELPDDWKEKAIDTSTTEKIAPESLDKRDKGPQGDGIEKSGIELSMNFNSIEEADMFKSLIEKWNDEGKINLTKEPVLIDYEFAKSENKRKNQFKDFVNFLEGVKTRIKGIHWAEEDNSKHKYLDEFSDDLSEFEDKFAEAGQSEFGRFDSSEIKGEEIEEQDPIRLVDLVINRTKIMRDELDGDEDYIGEISWIDDFLATCKQTKYRLQMQ